VGKPEGRRLLERSNQGWENNIKTDLQEVECVIWIGQIFEDRNRWWALVNAKMNLLFS
jgi:hypothetical protein